MRITALSAGSRTSPEADLERLTLWSLDRFQGRVSPADGTPYFSSQVSSNGVRSLRLSFRVAITYRMKRLKNREEDPHVLRATDCMRGGELLSFQGCFILASYYTHLQFYNQAFVGFAKGSRTASNLSRVHFSQVFFFFF